MDWLRIIAIIYYSGSSLVVLGTGIRFFYEFWHGVREDREFVQEFRDVHLGRIWRMLKVIGDKVGADTSGL